jgi:hypothetical protein
MGILSFREFLQIAVYCGEIIGEDNKLLQNTLKKSPKPTKNRHGGQ